MAPMLDLESDLDVLGHFESGEELVDHWGRRVSAGDPVAVAVIDLQLLGIDGIETATPPCNGSRLMPAP